MFEDVVSLSLHSGHDHLESISIFSLSCIEQGRPPVFFAFFRLIVIDLEQDDIDLSMEPICRREATWPISSVVYTRMHSRNHRRGRFRRSVRDFLGELAVRSLFDCTTDRRGGGRMVSQRERRSKRTHARPPIDSLSH